MKELGKDIVGYTEEEVKILGPTLFKFGISWFGPQTGMELLRIVEQIDNLKTNPRLTNQMREVLEGLRQRIIDLCNVGAHHQGAVLKRLEDLLSGGK